MSTVPGAEAWRDAGLAPADPDVPLRLTDVGAQEAPDAQEAEEYTPPFPRPDLDGRAAEADVVEQAVEVPVDDDGDDEDEGTDA